MEVQDEKTQHYNWDVASRKKHTNKNKKDLVQVDKLLHKK
jgi:hypothetical protein